MWELLARLIGGPIISGAINAYTKKLEAEGKTDLVAERLAAKELDLQQREGELQADYKRNLIGHWYEPANLAAYIFVLFLGKVVVWDTMLGLGTTPPIKGDVGVWLGMIAVFLFGKRGVENVAAIVTGALKRK